MPSATELAVTQAARVNEIGFPEFTTKLITDTFDALVSANLRQTQAYIELVQQVSKSLTQFIDDTRDDINGEQLMQFLATALPPENPTKDSPPTKLTPTATLDDAEATKLNAALSIPEYPAQNEVAAAGALTQDSYNAILTAVANRIAANKYSLLQEMVKMGILRLVVESGKIETRLTFTTYGSTFYEKTATQYHRDSFRFKAKASTGSFVSLWCKASASTQYNSINISTTKETNRDISGSTVQIYGSVIINFKTDYQPMTV